MKKVFKLATIIFFIYLLSMQSVLNTVAYAQEASSSASDIASPSARNVPNVTPAVSFATSSAQILPSSPPVLNPFDDQSTNVAKSIADQTLSQLTTSSLSNPQPASSAFVKRKVAVHALSKKSFRENEPIDVTVGNATVDQLQVSVTDPGGKLVDPTMVQETSLDSQTDISIKPATLGFRPGKYTLHITDADGNTTAQDFTWGVLAINTDKSIYLPQETAHMAMAVLDETGNMVCDAEVSLEITDPAGNKTLLSTATKTITVNSQCLSHNFSLVPDYEADYQVSQKGQYSLLLSATTKNGTNSISDTLSVVDSVPFDVTRISATRIYPPNQHPMLFHIKANQDFIGTIKDYTPPNFAVAPYSTASAQSYSTAQLVIPVVAMQQEFGVSSLSLEKPFAGNFLQSQGFGVALTDPKEKALYATFGLAGHDGLDFAVPEGTAVLATDDGTVSLAGDGSYGTTVVIDHSWGRSYYGHLSMLKVKVGDKVTKGQEIALSGNTGLSTGAHLHFGIKPIHPNMQNGFFGKVDPSPYLTFLTQTSNVLGITTTSSSDTANKVISWNVSLKRGDSIDLAYLYKVPPVSPELYTLGPLTFQQNGKEVVFQEARQWQLAIDANSTAGPNNCGTAVNDASTGGNAWGTPQNACTTGQLTTASTSLATGATNYLKVTNFGFTSGQIPSGSKIIGIQFSVPETGTTNSGQSVRDAAIRDVKGGTIDSGNDHSSASNWPSVSTQVTYGTTSDLWGQSWAPSDISASTFGIAISASHFGNAGQTATVKAFVTATITFNKPPNAPSQDLPANNATGQSQTPVFNMTATDPETDNLEYKVTIYSNSGCTTVVQTNDETSSQTGWSGQNVSGTSYTSGTQGVFTTQSALTGSTQYWWQASAIDPSGSNTFTNSATCNTFTTASSGPTLDQLMRHGKWFNNGVIQPFTF